MSTENETESVVVKFPRARRGDPRKRRGPINRPKVDDEGMIGVRVPGGTMGMGIDADEIADYYANPDDYITSRFGLSKVEYIEWIELDGMPLCGAHTKSGCRRNIIGHGQMGAHEWKAVHRVGHCHLHGAGSK